MRRGRPRRESDLGTLEAELAALKARQAELRQQIRRMKTSGNEIGKLQEKLEKQLAAAKWTVQQIHQARPDWDDLGFYQSVQAVQPKPRGRRPKSVESRD